MLHTTIVLWWGAGVWSNGSDFQSDGLGLRGFESHPPVSHILYGGNKLSF
ncbi:MAG: hypothetical protein ACXABO_14600 [Promethearchaeota archaeon]